MAKAVSSTVHIVFGSAAIADLQGALVRLGLRDRVISFDDNLAQGPIDPPDLEIRARWA